MKTTRFQIFIAAALACSLALLGAIVPANAAENKPNILFILTDNLGYGEVGAYGGGLRVAHRRHGLTVWPRAACAS